MKIKSRIVIVIVLLAISAHRLPAPIQEIPENPTPAPEQSAKPKPKRATKPKVTSENSESQGKTASSSQTRPTPKFAGTWTGTVNWVWPGGSEPFEYPSTYSIQISPDEKTISVRGKGTLHVDGVKTSQIACRREGDSLAWNYEYKGFLTRFTGTCTLRMNSNGTASFGEDREYSQNTVLKGTGTLTKQ
jgi:hypothetical protein